MRTALFSFILSSVVLSACASQFNGSNEALSFAEAHPISVEQQVITLTIDIDPTLNDVSAIDKSRLRAFARTYFAKGEGPITIIAPTGGALDYVGQQIVADIRSELHEYGVGWDKISGATYREGAAQSTSDIVLSFTNYVASASECGNWTSEFNQRFKNLRTKNFGCATQNNFAAMISDPRDLVRPNALGDGNSTRTGIIYEKFVKGETTSTEADESTEVQASESD